MVPVGLQQQSQEHRDLRPSGQRRELASRGPGAARKLQQPVAGRHVRGAATGHDQIPTSGSRFVHLFRSAGVDSGRS